MTNAIKLLSCSCLEKEFDADELIDLLTPQQLSYEIPNFVTNLYFDYMGINDDKAEKDHKKTKSKTEKKLNDQSKNPCEMDFDWLFYISKVHLNYSKVEFMEATHAEIYKMWMSHLKFNGWEIDEKDSENKTNKIEQKVYIDEIPFL